MEGFYDPHRIYQKELDEKRALHKPAGWQNAPKDKVQEYRTEPEWLLPELRSWMSFPKANRMAKVKAIEARTDMKPEAKDRQYRFICTVEKDREIFITLGNLICPKNKE